MSHYPDLRFLGDFALEVARGRVDDIKMFSVPGRKDNLSQTVLDDLTQIPNTTVVPYPNGQQLEIFSSSSNDAAAGTGMQTLEIHYLDSNGFEQNETVTLAGAGTVTTQATDIAFVQWIHGKSVGSGGVAAGNIKLQNSAGTVYEYVAAGGNQSLSAKYKVPTGKTGYVYGWQCSGISQRIDVRLRATVERHDRSLIPGVFLFQDICVLKDSTTGYIPFPIPLRMPAGAVVKMSGISSGAAGDSGGQFDVLLVDD
jgi:hypothetical protein